MLARTSLMVAMLVLALAGAGAAAARAQPVGPAAAMPTDIERSADVAAGSATVSDVLAGRVQFSRKSVDSLTGSPVEAWLRFKVPQPASGARDLYLQTPTAERAELFVRHADGTIESELTGTAVPFRLRSVAAATPTLILSPERAGNRYVFLRVRFHQEYRLRIRLSDGASLFDRAMAIRLVEGLLLGALLAVAIFNLYVFFALRERSAIFFVGYVCALAVNEIVATGLGSQYFWPDRGGDPRLAVLITNSLGFVSFLVFARAFLFTKKSVPRLDAALIVILAIEIGLAVAQYAFPAGRMLVLPLLAAELTGIILMAATGIVRWVQGFRPARYFVVAFIPATVGIFANIAYDLFLPRGSWFFAANGVEFGALFECVIISCSVLDRIRILEAERRRAADALAQESMHNVHLRRIVGTDGLTGLANRIAFHEALSQAIERAKAGGMMLGVLFVDLDAFKDVNDRFGHRSGDQLLCAVAAWLTSSVRTNDLVARIGGDEFAVLLCDMPTAHHIERVLESVRHSFDRSVDFDGHSVVVGASIGAGVYPRDGVTPDEVIDAADRAMYVEKERHRSQALQNANS